MKIVVEAFVATMFSRREVHLVSERDGYPADYAVCSPWLVSMSAQEVESGEVIENLPAAGLDFRTPKWIRITIEEINEAPPALPESPELVERAPSA